MVHRCLTVLLLAGIAVGQAAPAATPKPSGQSQSAGSNVPKQTAEVGPSTPVITIVGLCDKAAPGKTAAAKKPAGACKTVVTKAEFESLANALQPNMNAATKRMLADRYPKMLIFTEAAHKRGLDADPNFKKVLQFYRMQILTQELARSVKEKAEKVPETEIANYYKENAPEFEEADLQRVYVPKDKQTDTPAGDKPADVQKSEQESLKKEADDLRARAAAGETLDKLQKEAFDSAAVKGTPPQVGIGKLTRNELPMNHRPVLDLKAGEVSQVIADPNGFYFYKVISKDTKPLESVKSEIQNKLAQQKFQDEMQTIEQSAQTELNQAYFGTGPSMPGMPAGSMHPAPGPTRPSPPSMGAPAQSAPNPAGTNQNPSPESPKN